MDQYGAPRGRSRSRERGGGYAIDRSRDAAGSSSSAASSSSAVPAGGAATSGRRYFRKGPSGWDVGSGAAPMSAALASVASGPTQQTRHARRIYVGGLEAVPEQEIAELFTAIIRATMLNPLPADASPVLSVYINPERKFAFVEVATIELATALMALDGMTYKGQPLKIRRPHDYKPETLPLELRDKAEPLNLAALGAVGLGGGGGGGGGSGAATGIGTTGNRDSIYRIFIGGLPSAVEEPQLAELMSAFGEIKHLNIIRGPDGQHKGYGFCEYVDPAVTDTAVQSLHGLQLGDRTITVSRAKAGAAGGGGGGGGGAGGAANAAAASMAAAMAGLAGLDPAALAAALGSGGLAGLAAGFDPSALAGAGAGAGAGGAAGLMNRTPIGIPTRVVCLENMVEQSELANDQDYSEICEDVAAEAGKYGQVNMSIPRPPAPGAGRVFLQYTSLEAAIAAANALAGRKFGDNHIVATYYEEAAYAGGNLTA